MDKIKKFIGYNVMGIIIAVFILSLPIFLIKGTVWVGMMLEPIIPIILIISFIITIFIGFPLTLINKTKELGVIIIYIMSFSFGFILWLISFMYSMIIFGGFWTLVGLLFGGIGVIPLAMLGFVIRGYWSYFLISLVLIAFTYGTSTYANCISE